MKRDLGFYIEKYPDYLNIIRFYEKIINLQNESNLDMELFLDNKKKSSKVRITEGLPLIDKKDFIIDLDNSIKLFMVLFESSKNINDKLSKNLFLLEDAIYNKNLDVKHLIENFYNKSYLEFISKTYGIDSEILNFLIYNSITPSIRINVENLKKHIEHKKWLRGYCPICGDIPLISILREEGKRYLLCSYCSFEWLIERLKCPFCDNNNFNTLHYFFEEGDEIHRIDLCERCKQYIKTIDSRKQNYEMDIILEDVVTLHLDLIAIEKGYKRPVLNFWSI